jgi:hypothetical protein
MVNGVGGLVGGWCHVGVAELKTTGMLNGVEVTEL